MLSARCKGMGGVAMLSLQVVSVLGGALIACLVLRRLASVGRVDPREEACNELATLRRVVDALPEQLQLAERSRLAAAKAEGPLDSGATQQWLGELQADLTEADLIASQLPGIEAACSDAQTGLEAELRLVEILALSMRASGIADRYRPASGPDAADSEIIVAHCSILMHLMQMLPRRAPHIMGGIER
ncbi:MAG: hypothetical protein NVS1B6_03270 [Steroidobacteraceae bacterium]